ncbi:MAG: DUF1254 domain-containing protein [Hyphomicrobium sp.]
MSWPTTSGPSGSGIGAQSGYSGSATSSLSGPLRRILAAPMAGLNLLRQTNWRLVAATFCAAAILHICTTLAAPGLASAPPFERIAGLLPVNSMQILPPVTAEAQPLPFMAPDARYAICRFDTSKGTVALTATLPGPGWTLALHSREGDNFYTAVAQPERQSQVALMLIPSDERFAGLTPEAKGVASKEDISLTLVAREGVAILRAPEMGLAFKDIQDAGLARAKCGLKRG